MWTLTGPNHKAEANQPTQSGLNLCQGFRYFYKGHGHALTHCPGFDQRMALILFSAFWAVALACLNLLVLSRFKTSANSCWVWP